MKGILLFACILLMGINLKAQQLDGTYKSGADSITFSNDKVTFLVSGFGGLSSAHTGEGSYELNGEYLFIHTTEYKGEKSAYEEQEGLSQDSCVIQVVSPQMYAIQGILVEAYNKSGKKMDSKVTSDDGKVFFTPCVNIGHFFVSSLGYNPISFNYSQGINYKVKLVEQDIIENQTVAFKINFIDDETISLLMLSDDLNTNKDTNKELIKLERKARKTNKLEKRFKKVFVPYYYKKK